MLVIVDKVFVGLHMCLDFRSSRFPIFDCLHVCCKLQRARNCPALQAVAQESEVFVRSSPRSESCWDPFSATFKDCLTMEFPARIQSQRESNFSCKITIFPILFLSRANPAIWILAGDNIRRNPLIIRSPCCAFSAPTCPQRRELFSFRKLSLPIQSNFRSLALPTTVRTSRALSSGESETRLRDQRPQTRECFRSL